VVNEYTAIGGVSRTHDANGNVRRIACRRGKRRELGRHPTRVVPSRDLDIYYDYRNKCQAVTDDPLAYRSTLLSPLHRAMRQLTLFVEGHGGGLSGADGHLLSYVARYGPCPVGELARVFGHPPSTVTSILDRLEGPGLLGRECNPADRRSRLLRCTAMGRRKIRAAGRALAAVEAEVRARTNGRDWQGFEKVLAAVGDATAVKVRPNRGGPVPQPEVESQEMRQ
jgi:DNA-binding MarR family transcriptional regulator